MRRTTTILALTLGLVAPTATIVRHATAPQFKRMAPCVYEDGSGGRLPCYWDAKTRGNGQGTSYWIDRNGKLHTVR